MSAARKRLGSRNRKQGYRPFFEVLESRITPSLLGLAQEGAKPDITSGVTTNLSYSPLGGNANPFHYDSIPLWLTLGDGSVHYVTDPSSGSAKTSLDVLLDNTGQFAPGSANTFNVMGHVTLGAQTYDGALLTAQVRDFGFAVSPTDGEFEVRLEITGGLLAGPTDVPPNPLRVGDELSMLIHQPGLPITDFPQEFSISSPQGISDTLNRPAVPPALAPQPGCGCSCAPPGGIIQGAPAAGGNNSSNMSQANVNYTDGVVQLSTTELSSDGYGMPWGQTISWTNGPGYAAHGDNGNGIVDTYTPYLLPVNGPDTLAEVSNGNTAMYFDLVGGTYQPRFFDQSTLVHDSTTHQYILTDEMGNHLTFADFSGSTPVAEQGRFLSYTDRGGNLTTVTAHTADGKIAKVQRSATTGGNTFTESYVYSYVSNGVNSGLLQNVQLIRQINGGPETVVRQVAYTYYDGSQPYGNTHDLMLAVTEDANGSAIDTSYYRYYTGADAGAIGYIHGLKYAYSTDSYARLVTAVGDPFMATDAQVAPYADNYFQYDGQRRVVQEVVQGEGCSSCSGGLGTYTYSYTPSTNPAGYDSWAVKTVETLPDGNHNFVYSNYAGEQMLKVYSDHTTGQNWETFYHYDSQGRVILVANPSAVSGYDETRPDLLNQQGGHYQYLYDDAGLIARTEYYTTTTAGETTPGGVTGYVYQQAIERGQLGTPVLQGTTQYFSHTGGGATVYPTATHTVYRNTDGTGAETTSYSYAYYINSTRMQSIMTSRPTISADQNGPGTGDVTISAYDTYGRVISTTDADGFISSYAYDAATGAVTQAIRDVGGLNLTTQMQVDNLGRTTTLSDPNGNVTYTVYDDPAHEVRTYHGWQTSTNLPTGPTEVMREDLPGSYTETLTMAAVPHVTAGRPDGTEAISGLQTLSRRYISNGGQVVRTDTYYDFTGITYSTAPNLGTEGTNYNRTRYDYDERGRPNRVQDPTGTITRTVYDGLNRVISTWTGTNDMPASGFWSPTNNTPPANMTNTAAYVYDDGGVGDGNRTQMTQFPETVPADQRVMRYFYDWRDRLVAEKDGVQSTEDTTTHRPIYYTEYDNLKQSITSEQYDGDGIIITTTSGVPDRPAANRLRARTTSDYDDQGRVFRTHTFSVDQTSGAVSSNSLTTDTFYDHRGEVIKTAVPGGLVTKMHYDGAGRVVKTYKTDGLGDSTWADANTVANNNILSQTEAQYDANSNMILMIGKERFHDETAMGELGDPATAPRARVAYLATYYDAANRLVSSVNVGTNGGAAYTRPTTVAPRSDTTLITSYTYNDAGWVQDVTDPRGILTRTTYDNVHRTTKTIEGYTNGIPANDHDRVTEYTYDGSNHILTLTADLPGSAFQTTQYVHGVSTATGSAINSNDLLAATIYPDSTTGQPSTDQQVALTGSPTGGTFTLTFRGQTTTPLAYNADAPTVQFALQALWTIGSGNALVSGPAGGPWLVRFAGALAGTPVPELTGDGTALTGGNSPGVAVATQQETYSYNAMGQLTSKTDRNGTTHTYTYDVLGRQTSDAVTTLGAGVDGSVRRIARAYDTVDRPFLYTSYDAASGGNVVNQTQKIYNGLGQLITEYQSHSGTVDPATTPSVQYAYSEMSGGANHSRLVSMTYPDGRVLSYNYDAGLDDRISRLSSLSDASGILETYSYLGLGTVVQRAHPQTGVNLTYIQQPADPNANTDGGDQYTGLDRFGRVIDQLWLSTSGAGLTDRFQYDYDRDGNPLFRDNLVNPAFGELYHTSGVNDVFDAQGNLVSTSFIDRFNRLTDFSRGTLMTPSRDAILSPSHAQMWTLDVLGNWSSVATDGTTQNRTHNQQNEITSISGATTPSYDNNGNTTRDETGKTFAYDAWNRLVQVKDPSNTLLVAYSYDGLNRRVVENHGTPTDLYFSATWQVLEERSGATVQAQYVWSPVYVDALVERDRGSERLYTQQDANWNVTALVDGNGNVAERYVYDPYGRFTDPTGQITAVLAPDWSTRVASAFGWIYLHQGGRYDGTSGLYDFRNREYSPTLGRWMQQDPVGYVDQMNLYTYDGNNPLRVTDPYGTLPPGTGNLVKAVLGSTAGYVVLAWSISDYVFGKLFQWATEDDLNRAKAADAKLQTYIGKNPCPKGTAFDSASFTRDHNQIKQDIEDSLKSTTGAGGLSIIVARLEFMANNITRYCVATEACGKKDTKAMNADFAVDYCREGQFGNLTDYMLRWCGKNYKNYQVDSVGDCYNKMKWSLRELQAYCEKNQK